MKENREGRPQVLIKCMEKKYIDLLYKEGKMRFSCPFKWVKAEHDNGIGQGDKYEGTILIDSSGIHESILKKKYGNNLISSRDGDHIYYQLNTSLRCPTFCFYSVEDCHVSSDEEITKAGEYKVSFDIDGRFFTDFSHNKSSEEVETMSEDDRPAILIILGYQNIETFFERIRKAFLDQYSLTKDNILVRQVKYSYERTGNSDYICLENKPHELFYKGREFEHQREARIVINSKQQRKQKKDFLDLTIGSIEDISFVNYLYAPNGYKVEMNCIMDSFENIVKRDGKDYKGYSHL